MSERDDTSGRLDEFEAHRALLFGIAYRMLGVVADAEDVLQDARLRWLAVERESVRDVRAYLVTMVSRLSLDLLGSARARREVYVGPWLPEPIATTAPATDADSLSMAFLLLLEKLSPTERAAFLLTEVFDYSHRETAAVLETSEENARQIAARARRAVKGDRSRPVEPEAHDRLLMAFAMACGQGDVGALERLLADDATAHTDSGGKVRAARKVVSGRDHVARFVIGVSKKAAADAVYEVVPINGSAAIRITLGGVVHTVLTLDVDGDRIARVFVVTNPDKLGHATRDPFVS